MVSLRRCIRSLVVVSVVVSFVVSVTLLVALMVSDDSMRLCHEDVVKSSSGDAGVQGHSSSVLRQLNIALSSPDNDPLPVRYSSRLQ